MKNTINHISETAKDITEEAVEVNKLSDNFKKYIENFDY